MKPPTQALHGGMTAVTARKTQSSTLRTGDLWCGARGIVAFFKQEAEQSCRPHELFPEINQGTEEMDWLYRVLTGQTQTRIELLIGGLVVFAWIAIDVHQYIGYLREKSLGAPVGRRRIGRQAISAAERQRRRLKSAADNPAPGALDVKTVTAWWRDATNADRDEFLRELLRYLYFYTWLESKGIVTNESLSRSAPATRLDWEIEVDDEGEGYLSPYIEPNGLYI
jgi:hypothetical protein